MKNPPERVVCSFLPCGSRIVIGGVVKVVADVVLVLPDKLERDGHLFFLPEGKRIRTVGRVGAIQISNLGFCR